MSPLRKQMEADMAVRGLAYRTRETYVESVAKLAKFYGVMSKNSVDALTPLRGSNS